MAFLGVGLVLETCFAGLGRLQVKQATRDGTALGRRGRRGDGKTQVRTRHWAIRALATREKEDREEWVRGQQRKRRRREEERKPWVTARRMDLSEVKEKVTAENLRKGDIVKQGRADTKKTAPEEERKGVNHAAGS